MDAVTSVPTPRNEAVLDYAPDSPERAELQAALSRMWDETPDLPHWVDGAQVVGTGATTSVVAPFEHRHTLGVLRGATTADAQAAVAAAKRAAPAWRDLPFDDRAAVFLRAAELQREIGAPLLGINLGHVGFLAEAEVAETAEVVERALEGGDDVVERPFEHRA